MAATQPTTRPFTMSDPTFKAPSPEALQRLLPTYRFEDFIAQGGMGAVYKAHQRTLDRPVAIKILPKEFSKNQQFHHSFRNEARAMARLKHPNLIQVYGSGSVNGLPYIVMEFVPGESFFHHFHGKPIEPENAAKLIADICRGLAHAHEKQIVHRDIKPENILLTPEQQVKIGDFGLAHETDTEGSTMGTPEYTAPEVRQNPSQADQRSDVFSVGIILHELLTGHLPEDGKPGPSDPQLAAIWKKATDPDPEERYKNAGKMANALDVFLNQSSTNPNRHSANGYGYLIRSLIIITLLISAIGFVYDLYQKKQASVAAANQSPPEPEPAAPATITQPISLPLLPDLPLEAPELVPSLTEPEPPKPPPFSPAQSLRSLRDKLASGHRDPMPLTTQSHAGTYYFHVTFPMTADQAERFAIAYGGTLPLVRSKEELNWLTSQLGESRRAPSTWLGTIRHQQGIWQLLDASPWTIEQQPQGDGPLALLHANGSLSAPPESETHPFFITWTADGSPAVSLSNILQQTQISLKTDTPIFPRKSLSHGNSHYYIVTQSATHTEAAEFAKLAGAHLTTLGDEAESEWIETQLSAYDSDSSFWLGATSNGLRWKWDTGTPWTHARWEPSAPSGLNTTLTVVPNRGWKDTPSSEAASGFILEWSNEAAPPPAEVVLPKEDLDAKARGLLATVRKNYSAALKENSDSLSWHLDTWISGHKKSYTNRWKPAVNRLKAQIKNLRVPTDIPKSPNGKFTEAMIKIAADTANKQRAIDATFTGKAERIRDAYVERLQAERDQEFELGQLDLVRPLDQRIEAASDLKPWMTSLATE